MFYYIDMIELLLPCGFDTLEYSWVKATIGICMLADYFVAKKCQQAYEWFRFEPPPPNTIRLHTCQPLFRAMTHDYTRPH
jgi:hypothetical protein